MSPEHVHTTERAHAGLEVRAVNTRARDILDTAKAPSRAFIMLSTLAGEMTGCLGLTLKYSEQRSWCEEEEGK